MKPSIASKLYILDSSTISLFKALLKPAGRKRNDGKSKGDIKVHTLLIADSNMPSFIKYTAAAIHNQQFFECIKELPDGSIITFDKAYINYQQFAKFSERGITYVVPQKDNADFTSIKEKEQSPIRPAKRGSKKSTTLFSSCSQLLSNNNTFKSESRLILNHLGQQ